MTIISRRHALALFGGSLAASLGSNVAEGATKSFVAFGDSYTHSYRNGIASWADQIKSSGTARLIVNLAYSGATAEGLDMRQTLDGQVDRWVKSYRSKGMPDRMFIYFGYNDVSPVQSLAPAMAQYRKSLDRLISYGATRSGRRIVLCLLHDWSRNPARNTSSRTRVLAWNKFVTKLADERGNVVTANLYSRFEDVYRNKSKYGLTNVTDINLTRSATTYLYADRSHFGRKGQSIIAKELRRFLV
ncbi:MAG TPA: GDSL-type esterase/lipase family protein [Geminicoccus sp.]|jgi:phospholipase/lecithinase/hemolysin|uniref:GDSL-type esterase/lipase family protein n=1 Tax=Geminicoccus sp. TaxID=2024832 RepID=UPI002E301D61|nr:GDSL-type esterase/lipase family protein [Geminicoccus sp.]HEX2525604.1 GDSL-type esterase/lipase family protein [Geminicoccus sp.]